jgi:hypothetical protein
MSIEFGTVAVRGIATGIVTAMAANEIKDPEWKSVAEKISSVFLAAGFIAASCFTASFLKVPLAYMGFLAFNIGCLGIGIIGTATLAPMAIELTSAAFEKIFPYATTKTL